ncbi:MAG TPA: acyl-CoA dehydrogenase family protein [Gaiellaceae bacterium]|nr:acyl-CoA dehydrogenase family protein [Gaiellaceae bacterium]
METFWGPDLERWLGDSRRLVEFGAVVAQEIDPLVYELERDGPEADAAKVRFPPAYAEAGRAVWASGIVGAEPFEQAGLFFLLTHAGEGGHACPVTCTAGLVRALRLHGSEELRERFLPPLLETAYDACERGAQFLTEEHGGSDVGANLTRAVPDGDAWRLHGEKWFCSVADADQFVVTARPEGAPEGTRGIGCFLVPRLVEGRPNGFTIRKLKDKLGTRALATGEIGFDGALAYPIGAVEEGYRIAIGVVLNTSRWLNAVGSAAVMRRAYVEAAAFARERVAFGRPIVEFPLVQETLAVMRTEAEAALASALEVTRVVGSADPDDVAYHRILVNANKFSTSAAATRAVRRGIEVLGGNGTIEDFSVLPRLWRDAIVFESWEGTHNVLCAQVARDLERFGTLELVLDRSHGADPRVDSALESLQARLAKPDPLHVRRQLDIVVRAVQAAALVRAGAATAELHIRRHLVPGYDPERDPGYRDLVRELAGAPETVGVA